MTDQTDTAAKPVGPSRDGATSDPLDERQYLVANPDVAEAVRREALGSGRAHDARWGAKEGRDLAVGANDPRGRLITTPVAASAHGPVSPVRHSVEAVFVSRGGGVMLVGWIDDSTRALDSITVTAAGWRVTLDGAGLARRFRRDVGESIGKLSPYPFGYVGFVFGAAAIATQGPCQLQFRFRDGGVAAAATEMRAVEEMELRLIVLSHIAGSEHLGEAPANVIESLARGMGDHLIRFNRSITGPMVKNPFVERFGGPARKYRGSIIVCLYGRPEYHFLQNALFSGKPGIEDYEFIFVSNSPELADTLLANGKANHRLYGLDQTLVLLPGNAGFSAANNVAVQSAASDRILIMNPDVFPKDRAWAQKHADLIATRPGRETDLFGAPLYYDDGSLMHGGMFFEVDKGLSFDRNRTASWSLVRVEHYGKGAPAESPDFTRPRPVPAVTGAFISASRPWFEKLGGFSEDYVFGHYEDADLCLKSLEAGTAPWLQDLRLWHLEGKGSNRLPVHEGGSAVNRWLFSSRWGALVSDQLLGPAPSHPLLADDPAPARGDVTEVPAQPSPETTAKSPGRTPRLRRRSAGGVAGDPVA